MRLRISASALVRPRAGATGLDVSDFWLDDGAGVGRSLTLHLFLVFLPCAGVGVGVGVASMRSCACRNSITDLRSSKSTSYKKSYLEFCT